ncbi:hypothetical protein OG949_34150 [Streptomyces scopuliridis]|uniref:hypothetical protein n=1 Tax=Streptomyces scopuliridis TaxID=452529 RepID=UPI002DDA8671|nr:hypothetical protein [Streptomyces scopuliridis]WSB37390.1 hypothetical protein OG949_34150 [Streptomyces scopuliridis]
MLLNQVATARADFTGESLEAVRSRVAQLLRWNQLIPQPAAPSQALLEALLFGALVPCTDSLAPFGVVETIPLPDRLDVRVASPDVIMPFLGLLPYCDKAKEVHGVNRLLAWPEGRAVDFAFDHSQHLGLLRIRCRGVDLPPLLTEHQASVEAAGGRPLWTHSTPQPAPKGGRPRPLRRQQRQKPGPVGIKTRHETSQNLASALVRRPALWSRLAGHRRITVVAHDADHGLDWTLERVLANGHPLHDDRIPPVLGDALAGPNLIMDRTGHICLPTACTMRFIPRSNSAGWDGLLTIRTVHDNGRPQPSIPARMARPFTVLNESLTAGGPVAAPRPKKTGPPSTRPRRKSFATGRVLQLESPFFSSGRGADRWRLAQHLGAVWALQGQRVLLVRDTSRSWRTSAYPPMPWPTGQRPEAPTRNIPWQRFRLVRGPGDYQIHEGRHSIDELDELIPRARQAFDRIILVDDFDTHMAPEFLDGITDDLVIVVEDNGYNGTLPVTRPRSTASAVRHIPLSPEEAAIAWREKALRAVPLARIPVTGLLLAPAHQPPDLTDAFVARADKALERLGTPVLGRFTNGFTSQDRTVLDNMNDEEKEAFTAQAASIAAQLYETNA